jgi:uncharacterized protein YndB with AHSA1/START domain
VRSALLALAIIAAPATAEVKSLTDAGFEVVHTETLPTTPAATWALIALPSRWWNSSRTFSGDAKNLRLDPRAGGCFCETLKDGGVEHARVIFSRRHKQLRLNAPLGLQAEAVTARLTFTLTPEGSGTKLSVSYIVGGYTRLGMAKFAPIVDGVIGEQVKRLGVRARGSAG